MTSTDVSERPKARQAVAIDGLRCLAPFVSLAARFDTFSVCCSAEKAVPFAAAPGQDVFNAPLYTELRRAMLTAGELPADCQACLRHNTTHRLFQRPDIRAVAADNLERMDESYRISDFRLAYTFASLDSRCNLACRTCGSEFSTAYAAKISQHSARYFDQEQIIRQRRRAPDWVTGLISQTECCIEFQGGEPFLGHSMASLLEMMPSVSVRIVTNGTVYNRKALEQLRRFDDIVISFSMDGSSRTSAYVRRGLDVERLKRTLRQVAEALPQCEVCINLTISRYNVADIVDFVREVDAMDERISGFNYHFLEDIRALRLTSIDPATRATIIGRLETAPIPEGRFHARSVQLVTHVLRELRDVDTYDPSEDIAFQSFNADLDRDGA
jgi:organic radical activating enzyme